jgi:hypothetical protein
MSAGISAGSFVLAEAVTSAVTRVGHVPAAAGMGWCIVALVVFLWLAK